MVPLFLRLGNVEVGLQSAAPTYVTCPAVEATAQRVGESDADGDGGDAQLLEHLDDGLLVRLNQHTFGVQHQDVHRKPLGRHPQRML